MTEKGMKQEAREEKGGGKRNTSQCMLIAYKHVHCREREAIVVGNVFRPCQMSQWSRHHTARPDHTTQAPAEKMY